MDDGIGQLNRPVWIDLPMPIRRGLERVDDSPCISITNVQRVIPRQKRAQPAQIRLRQRVPKRAKDLVGLVLIGKNPCLSVHSARAMPPLSAGSSDRSMRTADKYHIPKL